MIFPPIHHSNPIWQSQVTVSFWPASAFEDRHPKSDDWHLTEFSPGGFRSLGRNAAAGHIRSFVEVPPEQTLTSQEAEPKWIQASQRSLQLGMLPREGHGYNSQGLRIDVIHTGTTERGC